MNIKDKVNQIDAMLPQTQCGDCGFSGCIPYAEALAHGLAPIDRCPPGGEETIRALGELLNIKPEPYLNGATFVKREPSLAFIRELDCIGCTKCITACPVDAIIGSAKKMHTVIPDACTGCGLCVEPCPVDCIELLPIKAATYDKNKAREHFKAKKIRELREQQEQQKNYREKRLLVKNSQEKEDNEAAKRAYILQALARVQAKKNE